MYFILALTYKLFVNFISRELNKLHVWLSVDKLSLNVDKTNYILFGNRKNIDNVCISMNNSILTRVRATKFLGVIIDEKLTWKYHISLVRSKLTKTVGILYRVIHLLNRSALFILYCSMFLPYLTYCAEIWGNTYKSNIQCIFQCRNLANLACVTEAWSLAGKRDRHSSTVRT